MDLWLQGQYVLITGASKGIGYSTALAFAREGCHLHLTARSEQALKNIQAEIIDKYKVDVSVYPLDMSEQKSIDILVSQCSGVDILINNAGEIPSGPLESLNVDVWRKSYDVKLFGYMLLTRGIYEKMKARRCGVILNDIGNSGENWDANYIAGSTANAALMAFTKALGGVSLDHGVRVLAVNPGPVETERMIKINKRRAIDLYGDESKWESLRDLYPGGRPASPDEIADLIVFLSSPRAGYISGSIITIDGGIASKGSIIKPRSIS